ncbi:hypothetical protein [uncultured Muribaculum sp.]|uniref:hypothetical protein n=1 Tax=uncultured Muribaculum sp. TaxID=1918613 RepID=UPI00321F8221
MNFKKMIISFFVLSMLFSIFVPYMSEAKAASKGVVSYDVTVKSPRGQYKANHVDYYMSKGVANKFADKLVVNPVQPTVYYLAGFVKKSGFGVGIWTTMESTVSQIKAKQIKSVARKNKGVIVTTRNKVMTGIKPWNGKASSVKNTVKAKNSGSAGSTSVKIKYKKVK